MVSKPDIYLYLSVYNEFTDYMFLYMCTYLFEDFKQFLCDVIGYSSTFYDVISLFLFVCIAVRLTLLSIRSKLN